MITQRLNDKETPREAKDTSRGKSSTLSGKSPTIVNTADVNTDPINFWYGYGYGYCSILYLAHRIVEREEKEENSTDCVAIVFAVAS